MRPELWKIYDKKGSNLNIYGEPILPLIITGDGKDAAGYAITDPSSLIVRTHISNSGWGYTTNTSVKVDYQFSSDGQPISVDASITYVDVSIFNPVGQNSSGIKSITIDSSAEWFYPATTYAAAIFLDPVSQGLVETEHLTFFRDDPSLGFINPYDTSNSTLLFRMMGDEDVIKFFTLDENSQEISWADELIFDVSSYVVGRGLQVNVGFRADDEGVYERRMLVYHVIDDEEYPLLEIIVNAQSIGKDERFDALLSNFGLYKPESISQLFKEVDINEDLPDWKILNYKAKHLILEHNHIMPFIGTYKGLINAIKWLGYEDIKVKEWFKNVKENKKLSLYVPYDAEGRMRTIKMFSPAERRNLKKLNQLSLVYCINRETGEYDEWGNPETENCYEYNLNEILIKLFALKKWLEKNIIGVNARIWDLTGEGIYIETFKNFIYGTQNLGTEANYVQSLTPTTVNPDAELVSGDASILLTLKEYDTVNIQDTKATILDMARYVYAEIDGTLGLYSPTEYVNSNPQDPSAVWVGSPFVSPWKDLYDIQWKLSVDKEKAGVVTTDFVTAPLLIKDNEIKFYNYFDTSSRFFDISANVDVTLEKAYLRDPSIDVWEDSIAYSIYKEYDASTLKPTGKWIVESSMGVVNKSWGYVSLQTTNSASLTYAFDDNYMAPLFFIENYKWTDASGISHVLDRDYYLDIEDGKISMDSSTTAVNGDLIDIENFINFNYDTSLSEQKISLIVTYTSPRMPIFSFDPAAAEYRYHNPEASLNMVEDNSIYRMDVNHAGNYNIEIYGWNGQNNLFFNFDRDGYDVYQKYPTINSYIDTSCAGNVVASCTSTYLTAADVSLLIDKYPIFERIIPLQGLTLMYDTQGMPYINVPSITYFQDLPKSNSITRYYNLTERIYDISGVNIKVDQDYQSFLPGDLVNLVHFDKGKYSFIKEASASIVAGTAPNFVIDNAPLDFANDVSTDWYILNSTERDVKNGVNNVGLQTFTCDIADYRFRENQLVAILIENSTGKWGASFRVLDSSTTLGPNGYQHVLKGNIPEFCVGDCSLYAKHAFSAYSDFSIDVVNANEVNNDFEIYLDDVYYHQYYLDDTFVLLNINFDQERVLEQWYDPSTDGSLAPAYYPFDHSIQLDISTLVILRSEYDVSNYMIGQKNIWTITNHDTNDLIMEVFNDSVSYIFNEAGEYDVKVESYDSYGNLKTQLFEGLIKINDD